MFCKRVSALLSLLLVVTSPIFAKVLILSEVMTREEQKETGIDTLNAKQKMALQDWLNKKFVLKSELENPKEEKAKEGKARATLYLSQNIDNGSQLVLSDDSVYQVAPADIVYSSAWITPFPLRLEASGDPEYPVKIVNAHNGKGVKAKQIRPPRQ